MENLIEKTLPSGTVLKIQLASFANAKALFQAVCEELQTLDVAAETELDINLLKNLFCLGLSSKKIEIAMGKCLEKVLYDNVRITEATFEPESARQDYVPTLLEVAQVNLAPFLKNLLPRLSQLSTSLVSDQKS
jgi:hypothetical protein